MSQNCLWLEKSGSELDQLRVEGEPPVVQHPPGVGVLCQPLGKLLQCFDFGLGILPGDCAHVLHKVEVSSLLVRQTSHIAELGNKDDWPDHASPLLSQTWQDRQERLPHVPEAFVVLLRVVLGIGDISTLPGECGLGVQLPVDVVNLVCLVVVLGHYDGSQQGLLHGGSEVTSGGLRDLLDLLQDGVSAQNFVSDLAAQQDAVLMLPDGSLVAWPNLQLVIPHGSVPRLGVEVVSPHQLQVHSSHSSSEDEVKELHVVVVGGHELLHHLDGQGDDGVVSLGAGPSHRSHIIRGGQPGVGEEQGPIENHVSQLRRARSLMLIDQSFPHFGFLNKRTGVNLDRWSIESSLFIK